jgi:hypothetical protein
MPWKHHPTVELQHPTERWRIPIDEEIAQLISAIWALGLSTQCTCQNDRGRVYLDMPSRDAQILMTLVARGACPAVAQAAAMANSGAPGSWSLKVFSNEILCHLPDDDLPDKFDDVELVVGIRFPCRQLDEVTRTLARAVAQVMRCRYAGKSAR